MLGRDPVGQNHSLGHVLNHDHRAEIAPAFARDLAAFQRFEALFNRRHHRLSEIGVIGDQNGLRAFVVFGLA